ncbi:MAG TPA: putative 2-aminoethylphosphonate ABC transporter ATP-binding protein [Geminicoccaceae bacterium]|nr:putative 2-aminoethylphosphonate ABC transporter ATP-binding protein [Geminicoccaceae bacterium]
MVDPPTPAAEQPAPYLRVRDLTKRFGAFTALDRVSLDVHEGEFVAFLGPSGCGKTTLLRAISGLDVQSEGTIHQAGRDISSLPVSRRDFGIVFQSYALFPNLTIRDNVAYGLTSTGVPRAKCDARVAELLELVGLSDQVNKYPAQLSGGQQQRVALARALALSPGLLLLDEPLSALDARVRARLRGEVRDLQRRLGVTTIMVTHDQEEALTMSDRIVVMNHGRIEQVGTPDEIYGRPATAFVADFVGKMNFLRARLLAPDEADVSGARLQFVPPIELAPGAPLTVCLRPEDVVVRETQNGQANVLEVRVGVMEFIGNHFATTLHAVGTSLNISADFSMNAVRDLQIAPGRTIKVALPPDRLRVFPQPPA